MSTRLATPTLRRNTLISICTNTITSTRTHILKPLSHTRTFMAGL